jgi:hypothetical protein
MIDKLSATQITFIALQFMGWVSFVVLVIDGSYWASAFPLVYVMSMEIKSSPNKKETQPNTQPDDKLETEN